MEYFLANIQDRIWKTAFQGAKFELKRVNKMVLFYINTLSQPLRSK